MGRLNYDPAQGIFFQVEFLLPELSSKAVSASFSKISGMSAETEAAEYRTGDDPPVKRQIPGLTSFGDVTFEDGLDPDQTIEAWRQMIVGTTDFATGEVKAYNPLQVYPKGDVTVRLMNCREEVLRQFKLVRAWPSAVEYGDLDASSSDVVIRTVTFKHEGLLTLVGDGWSVRNRIPDGDVASEIMGTAAEWVQQIPDSFGF